MAHVAATVHAPPSPFSSLLRRSRFASFDPAILQSYTAPPEYAHRGNFGLKRPLPARMRKPDKFIAIPAPFESHAQYTAWDNAENEVRFVKRFEEMQVYPKLHDKSDWFKTLGNKHVVNWLYDSEFSEAYEGPEVEEDPALQAVATREAGGRLGSSGGEDKVDMGQLIEAGRTPSSKSYGQNRPLNKNPALSHSGVTPNIYAMPPQKFKRYVEHLRTLRPRFQKHIDHIRDTADKSIASPLAGKSLFKIAQNPNLIHRYFLYANTAAEFNDRADTKIEPRPHHVGGLVYTKLSNLHTSLYAQTHPGIVLHAFDPSDWKNEAVGHKHGGTDKSLLVSFAGMGATIDKTEVATAGKQPLFDLADPEASVNRDRIRPSILKMRAKPGNVELKRLPVVVGKRQKLLEGAEVATRLTALNYAKFLATENPEWPGTTAYMTMDETKESATTLAFQGTLNQVRAAQDVTASVQLKRPRENVSKHNEASRDIMNRLGSLVKK